MARNNEQGGPQYYQTEDEQQGNSWMDVLRKQRREQIINKDLYTAVQVSPLVHFMTSTDPDRTHADLVRIGALSDPERNVITWTSAQSATHLQSGKPMFRMTVEDQNRVVKDQAGNERTFKDKKVTRHEITTLDELIAFVTSYENPSIFYLPNFHLALQQAEDKRALIDLFSAMFMQLRDQNKAIVIQTPPGVEMPPELVGIMQAVKEAPVTRDERSKLLMRIVAETGLNPSPQVAQQILDATTGLNLTSTDAALRNALVRHYNLDAKTARLVMQYKREQMSAQNLWEPMDTQNVPNLVGWDNFENMILERQMYGAFDLNSPHNLQMVLLIGQAGTGKTTMARRVGQILNRPAYLANVSGWMGGLMGQTEQRMRQAVDSIYSAQPCVAVIDEAQRVLQNNDQKTSGGTMNRSIQSLLTRMEQGRQDGDQVLWILTANERDTLPPELFRRGETWAVHFPGPNTRVSIFRSIFHRFAAKDRRMQLDSGLSDQNIAKLTEGLGGGDIEKLISMATIKGRGTVSIQSIMDALPFLNKQDEVTPEIIARRRQELANYPSVSTEVEEGMAGIQRKGTIFTAPTAPSAPEIVIPPSKAEIKAKKSPRKRTKAAAQDEAADVDTIKIRVSDEE